MKQIISVGGGGFTAYNSELAMERYILAQVENETPKVGFLPQASAEAPSYVVQFLDSFKSLGADPSWFSLFNRVQDDLAERILEQDVIYVGGGNTRSMLSLWREWGIDEILKEAYEQGTLLCGVSAGAICWFEQCVTDSVWPLGVIDGLGFIEGSCCPHYDSEPTRRPTYLAKVAEDEMMPGIALQDFTAAHYIDGVLHKVVTEVEGQKAFRVDDQEQPLSVEVIT